MNTLLRKVLLLVFVPLMCLSAYADHISGANMEYRCLGGGDFLITLNVFQDCSDLSSNATETVWIINNTGGFSSQALNLVSATEVSQLCAADLPNSLCSGGIHPGKRHLRYEGIISYDNISTSYRVRWIRNYRTPSINVDNTASIPFYVHTIINFDADPCNDSPIISIQQSPFICVGNQATLNFGVIDPEQDSLHFSFSDALQPLAGNSYGPVIYEPGYSGPNPIPGATINPITGQMSFTPPAQGEYTIAVLVEQFNDLGQLLGSQIIDILVVARICPSPPPEPQQDALINTSGTATFVGPTSISMCSGQNFCADYVFQSSSPTAEISVSSNLETILPGATLMVSGTNPATATICWDGSTATNGGNIILIASDGLCPIPGIASAAINVEVLQGVLAGPDLLYCENGTVQLQGSGSVTYSWASISGDGLGAFSCTNCPNPIITPTQPSVFELTGDDLGNGCGTTDQVSITPALPRNTTITQTGCGDNDGGIMVTILDGSGDYSVLFGGDLIPLEDNIFDTTMLSTGFYPITLYDNGLGCEFSWTPIVSSGVGTPDPDITALAPVCSLETDLDGLTSGGTIFWTGTGPGTITFDDATLEDPHVTVSMAGTYSLYITETATCTGVDSISVTFGPPESVTASNDTTVCGLNIQLSGQSNTGTWAWIDASATAIFSPNADVAAPAVTVPGYTAHTFFWTHTNPNGCTSTGQVDVDFREQPMASSPDTLFFCQLTGNALDAVPAPAGMSGTWDVAAGGFTYNPVLPNSAIDYGGTYGFYEAIWTIENTAFCLSSDTTVLAYIAPEQALISGAEQEICGPQAQLSSANTSGTWSSPDSELSFSAATSTTTTVTSTTAGIYTVNWTVGLGTCATSDSQTITFYDSALVSIATLPTALCSNGELNLTADSSNGTALLWTTSGDGQFSDNTILNPGYSPGSNDSIAGTVTLTITNSGEASCPSVSDQLTFNVIPAPYVDIVGPSSATLCDNVSIPLDGIALNTSDVLWTTDGGDGSFLPNNSTIDIVYELGTMDLAAGSISVYLSGNSSNAVCPSVNDSLIISLVSASYAGIDSISSICETASPVNVMSLFGVDAQAGGTITDVDGSGGLSMGEFNPTLAGPGTYHFDYEVLGTAPCLDDQAMATITVTPGSEAGTGYSIEFCSSDATGDLFNLLTDSPDTGGTWEEAPVSGGLAGGVFSPSTPMAGDYDLMYISQLAGCAPDTAFVDLTLGTLPTIDAGPATISVCGNESLNISAIATDVDSVLWTTAGDGGFDDPMAVNPQYTPGIGDIGNGSVILRATAFGSPICANPWDEILVNVSNPPNAGLGDTLSLCEDGANANLFLILTGDADTGGSWSDLSASGGLFGNSFDPSASGPGNYDLVYIKSLSGCENDTAFVHVSVSPLATIDAGPANAVICGNQTLELTAVTSNTDSLLWTSTGDGTFSSTTSASSLYTPGAGDILAGGTVIRALAYGSPVCTDPFDEIVLTINIPPNAGIGDSIQLCQSAPATDLALLITGNPDAGGIWLDLSASMGLTGSIFDPSAVAVGLYDFAYMTSLASCNNDSAHIQVEVGAAPTIDVGGNAFSICETSTLNLGAVTGQSDSVLWSSTGTGVFSQTVGFFSNYTPSEADITAGSVSISSEAYGLEYCPTQTALLTLTIDPITDAGRDSSIVVCTSSNPIDLSSLLSTSAQAGGAWSDNSLSGALTGSVFDPSSVLANTYEFGYTVSNTGLCPDSTALFTIEVSTAAYAGEDSVYTTCQGAQTLDLFELLEGSPQAGGTWTAITQATGLTGSTLDLDLFTPGSYDYSYEVIIADCNSSDLAMVSIIIAAPAEVSFALDTIHSCAVQTINPIASYANVTNYSWSSAGDGSFDLATATSPEYTPGIADQATGGTYLYVTVLGSDACPAVTDSVYVLISPMLSLSLPASPIETCGFAPVLIDASLTNHDGLTWNNPGSAGVFSDNAIINPIYTASSADLTVGFVDLQLNVQAMGTCPDTLATLTLEVTSPAVAGVDSMLTLCISGDPVDISPLLGDDAQTGGSWSVHPALAGSTFLPSLAGIGTTNHVYTITGSGVCPDDIAEISVTVSAGPSAGQSGDTIICASNTNLELFGVLTGTADLGGTWTDLSGSGALTAGILDASTSGIGTFLFEYESELQGCQSATSIVTVEVISAPTVEIFQPILSVCSSDSINIEALALNSTEIIWTSGGISEGFSSINGSETDYGLSVADLSAGSVTLTITASGVPGCATDSDEHTVLITASPEANAGMDDDACGLSYNLNPTPSIGSGTWSAADAIFTDASQAMTTVTVPSLGNYEVVWTENNQGCIDADTLSLNFVDSPGLIDYNTICVNTNTQYEVIIELSGGDQASYQSSISGSFNDNVFTSAPLTTGASFDIDIWDSYACDTLSLSGDHLCPTLTYAGSFEESELSLCEGDMIAPNYFDDAFLDANDILLFILHTDNPGLGTILASSSSPAFNYQAGMVLGTTYYVSAVAGDEDSPGSIDFDAPETEFSSAVAITFYAPPSLNLISEDLAFCEGDSSYIELELGGVPGFEVNYSIGADSFTHSSENESTGFYASTAGTLNINTLTDAQCAANMSASLNLEVLSRPSLTALDSVWTCSAAVDSVMFDLSGIAPWSYLLLFEGVEMSEDSTIDSSNSFLPASTGTYTITGLADANCPALVSTDIVVEIIQNPIVDAGPDLIICSGEIVQVGGDPQLQTEYQWSPITYCLSPDSNYSLVDVPLVGDVIQTDTLSLIATHRGCVSADEMLLSVSPLPANYGIIGDTTICIGDTMNIVGYGGTSYIWTPSTTLTPIGASTASVYPSIDTEYYLEISNQYGCTVDTATSIYVQPIPVPVVSTVVAYPCPPAQVLMLNETIGELAHCYWNLPGAESLIDDCSLAELSYADPGLYGGSLTVTSIYGCTDSVAIDSVQIFSDEARFSASPSPLSLVDSALTVYDLSENVASQIWTLNGDSVGTGFSAEIGLEGLRPDFYDVCLIITSNDGCRDTTCHRIELENNVSIYVPSAFTPDGDRLNDVFKAEVDGLELIEEFELMVFDRMGRLQFKANDPTEGWDGINKRDNTYAQSLYEWVIEVKVFGEPFPRQYRGTLTILK